MKNIILKASFILLTVTIASAQERNDNDDRRKGPPTIKQIFKELDTNEDGKLSKKEVQGPLKKDFKKIDLDKDGFITKKELRKAPKPERREQPRN